MAVMTEPGQSQNPGALSSLSYAQFVGPSSSVFPGIFEGDWMGNSAAGTQTSSPVCYAGVIGDGLTYCIMAPAYRVVLTVIVCTQTYVCI